MMHFWSKFGKPHFIWFWLIARINSQAQNGVNLDFQAQFDLEDHCQSTPQNNRDLNQGLLHLWSKFGDPSLNGWWIIARTSSWLTDTQTHTHTHTHTRAGNDNTRRPKLASGKKTTIFKQIRVIFGSYDWQIRFVALAAICLDWTSVL